MTEHVTAKVTVRKVGDKFLAEAGYIKAAQHQRADDEFVVTGSALTPHKKLSIQQAWAEAWPDGVEGSFHE